MDEITKKLSKVKISYKKVTEMIKQLPKMMKQLSKIHKITKAICPSISSAFVKGPQPQGGSAGIKEIPFSVSFLGYKNKFMGF